MKKKTKFCDKSIEAKYKTMILVTCELIWLEQLHRQLIFEKNSQIYVTTKQHYMFFNLVFHYRTKHIKIKYHFIKEKLNLFLKKLTLRLTQP